MVCANPGDTQTGPTFSRSDLGAGSGKPRQISARVKSRPSPALAALLTFRAGVICLKRSSPPAGKSPVRRLPRCNGEFHFSLLPRSKSHRADGNSKGRRGAKPRRHGRLAPLRCASASHRRFFVSGFAAWSRMAPRTAPLRLHSTPAISAAAAVNAHSGARAVRSPRSFLAHRPLGG